MATSESVANDCGEDCSKWSGVTTIFVSIAGCAEGGPRASFSSGKPGIGLPSSSVVVPRSGPVIGPGEAPGALATVIGQWDSGKGSERSDRVIRECVDSDGPVGGILSRTGLEAGDGRLSESEGVRVRVMLERDGSGLGGKETRMGECGGF